MVIGCVVAYNNIVLKKKLDVLSKEVVRSICSFFALCFSCSKWMCIATNPDTSVLTPNFRYLQLEVMKIETAELLLEIEGIAGGNHGNGHM